MKDSIKDIINKYNVEKDDFQKTNIKQQVLFNELLRLGQQNEGYNE